MRPDQTADSGGAAHRYNGRIYDSGTGFHDNGARMYWPEIARFVSSDSYQGSTASPASMNRYSYVVNNPYRYTDPTGHKFVEIDASVEPVLRELRKTETGKALYDKLEGSAHEFRIKEEKGPDVTRSVPDSPDLAEYRNRKLGGTGGTTRLRMDVRYKFEDEKGQWQEAPLSEVLAHELNHLSDFDSGMEDNNPDHSHRARTTKEREAMDTENKVRKELGLQGSRIQYDRSVQEPK
ncbi:MAG: RHS repeat-associated core domain-containing protein [Anaeromyxobacter sp.]